MLKMWVTYWDVVSLQIGGLQRCRVWFRKPEYHYVHRNFEYSNLPFGGGHQKEGLEKLGWVVRDHGDFKYKERGTLSLGDWLGYDHPVSDFVWAKLCEHFKSSDLRQWDTNAEKYNIQPENFILEIDLKIEQIC